MKKAKKKAKKSAKTTKKSSVKATKKVTKKVTKSGSKKTSVKKATKKNSGSSLIAKSESENSAKASMVGLHVPPLTLKNSNGEDVSLEALKGRKIVLYFYPKDDTPGCTIEGQQFSDLYSEFKAANTEVFGLSRDSVASHDKFRCKFGFGFELLSDVDEKMSRAFDVIKQKNMYGKMVWGIERSTFVIDEDGKIVREYRKVSPDGHAAEILSVVKSI